MKSANNFSTSLSPLNIGLMFASFLILLAGCSKPKQSSQNIKYEAPLNTEYFYQKELPYWGNNGEIDSILIEMYTIPNDEATGDKKLTSDNIRRFDEKGYVYSFEQKTYDNNELFIAECVLYERDSNYLEISQKRNALTKMGSGYAIQYTLHDRQLNKETWEKIEKGPTQRVTLKAIIKEFSENEMKIFDQVGNTDSVTLSANYVYNDDGFVTDAILYKENRVIYQQTEYNDKKQAETMTTSVGSSLNDPYPKEEVYTYEYEYDEKDNPIIIKVYLDGKLVNTLQYKIYYRN